MFEKLKFGHSKQSFLLVPEVKIAQTKCTKLLKLQKRYDVATVALDYMLRYKMDEFSCYNFQFSLHNHSILVSSHHQMDFRPIYILYIFEHKIY